MRNSQFTSILIFIAFIYFFGGYGYGFCQPNRHVKDNEYILSWRKLQSPSVNFGFDDDSLAIWFQPLGACSLKSVRLYNVNFEGQLTLDIWESPYKGHIVTTDSVGSLGRIGTWWGDWQPADVFKISPLGEHLWGAKTIAITQSDTNKWIEIPLTEDLPFINDRPFIIGFYCKRDGGRGFGGEDEGTVPYHFFRAKCDFYSISEWPGWYIEKWSIWLEAVVKYISDTRPQITNIPRLETQQMNKGPFQVSADIIDFNPMGGDSGVKSAKLCYIVDQGDTLSVAMNPLGNDTTFVGNIAAVDDYDFIIYYWVEAEDVNGNISKSYTQFFYGLGPIHQPILVIGDYGRVNSSLMLEPLDQWFLRTLRGEYDPSKKYVYFLWDKWRLKCFPSLDVLQNVNTILWYTGRTPESDFLYLPAHSDSNILAKFIDRGGNLLLQDQNNLVRAYFLWEPPLEFELPEGNFFRDYMGVRGYYESYQNWEHHGMNGIPNNELTGYPVFMPMEYRPSRIFSDGSQLYLDSDPGFAFAPAEDAEVIFTSDVDSCVGIRVANPKGSSGKTVFISTNLMAFEPTQPGYHWPEQHDRFLLNVLEWFGTQASVEQESWKMPQQFILSQNYPNPFNSTTEISYYLPRSEKVEIIIFNLLGEKIRTLLHSEESAGWHRIRWDGKDENGIAAASGIYFYRLKTENFEQGRKMALIR